MGCVTPTQLIYVVLQLEGDSDCVSVPFFSHLCLLAHVHCFVSFNVFLSFLMCPPIWIPPIFVVHSVHAFLLKFSIEFPILSFTLMYYQQLLDLAASALTG